MKTLLIATTNPAKRAEILTALQPLVEKGVQILTLNEVTVSGEPKETGLTFEENAKIKAEYYAKATNFPTLADDGGLMIDALGGEPGVKSKRWLGYDASDNELINHTLTRLKGLPEERRSARLQTCVCFYNPENASFICQEENIEGRIAEKPSKKLVHGFPYRALLIINKFNKYYDELTHEEHDKINHRLRALKRLLPKLEKYLVE